MSTRSNSPLPNIVAPLPEVRGVGTMVHTQSLLSSSVQRNHDVDERVYFISRFGWVPNLVKLVRVDGSRIIDWLKENYLAEVRDLIYVERKVGRAKGMAIQYLLIQLFEDLVISVMVEADMVHLAYRNTDPKLVSELADKLSRMDKREKKVSRISVLVGSGHGISLEAITLKRPEMKMIDYYNDDFQLFHEMISRRLMEKGKGGLVLLHGKPGCGKTTYIRHLAQSIRTKIIFIPPAMVGSLSMPGLLELLIENKNCVLVIEDAEQAIKSRNETGASAVSVLLNITDGLLTDILGIKVICSFNTDISKIDEALLRPGRLIAKYEFGELMADKAKRLAEKLGISIASDQSATLAEIFHQRGLVNQGGHETKRIGFRRVKTPQPCLAEEFPY